MKNYPKFTIPVYIQDVYDDVSGDLTDLTWIPPPVTPDEVKRGLKTSRGD